MSNEAKRIPANAEERVIAVDAYFTKAGLLDRPRSLGADKIVEKTEGLADAEIAGLAESFKASGKTVTAAGVAKYVKETLASVDEIPTAVESEDAAQDEAAQEHVLSQEQQKPAPSEDNAEPAQPETARISGLGKARHIRTIHVPIPEPKPTGHILIVVCACKKNKKKSKKVNRLLHETIEKCPKGSDITIIALEKKKNRVLAAELPRKKAKKISVKKFSGKCRCGAIGKAEGFDVTYKICCC